MKSYFEDSEKNGTGMMRTFISIERGDFLQRVIIQNNVTSMKTAPRYLEFNTYSNMTLWELKKAIAQKLKMSPLKLQLTRPDVKKKTLNESDHIKLLRDLKFESFEIISASKKA